MDITTKDNAQVATQHINGKKLTLRDMKRASLPTITGKSIYIVADISGSMGGNKLTSLKDALKRVYKPGIKVFAFSDETYELQESDFSLIKQMGGTYMLNALRETWRQDPKHIILITDGEPTDASTTEILLAAEAHKTIPIDTIGISEYGHRGFNAKFLEELSRITGGKFNDCSRPFELTFVIETLLIGMGNEKRGDIRL
jgi:uncharacterized protein YegL